MDNNGRSARKYRLVNKIIIIMKKIYLLFVFTALVLVSSCTGDKSEYENISGPIKSDIELFGKLETRGGASEECYPFRMYALVDNETTWNNVLIDGVKSYLYNEDNSIAVSNVWWPLGGDKLHFFGVMKSGDAGDAATVRHSVPITSDGFVNVEAGEGYDYDFLLSNNLITGKESVDVDNEMNFRHIMTQLIIKVNIDTDDATQCRIEGNIAAGSDKGDYSAFAEDNQALASASERAEDYNIAYDVTGIKGGSEDLTKIYHLVADGSFIYNMTDVRVNDIETGDVIFLNSAENSEGVELKPGLSYTLTLNVNSRGVESAEIEIAPWVVKNIGDGTYVQTGKRINVTWDAYGADVTAIELIGEDNTVFSANVVKTADGAGYAEGAKELEMTIKKVYGYHGDVRVEMTSPVDDSGLWSYDAKTNTIDVERVLVATPGQLAGIENAGGVGKHYYQVCDLDLSGYSLWSPVCRTTALSGSYVGGGFNIRGLKSDLPAYDYIGLFGQNKGLIRDIHIKSGVVSGLRNVGGICAVNQSGGAIENCVNEADISVVEHSVGGITGCNNTGVVTGCINRGKISSSASKAGGVVGWNFKARLSDCENFGVVRGNTRVGGIVGEGEGDDTIEDCKNYGYISSTNVYDDPDLNNADYVYVGGIAGSVSSSQLVNCENHGEIFADGSSVGGIVGEAWTAAVNCTNYGAVTAMSMVGGISGGMYGYGSTVVSNCQNYGEVTGTGQKFTTSHINPSVSSYTAGIVGYSYWIDFKNCDNYGFVSGDNMVGGIAGRFEGTTNNCHNHSAVKGRCYVGGILGYMNYYGGNIVKIINCTNSGSITGYDDGEMSQAVGGICGSSAESNIDNCHNTGTIAGVHWVGGVVGYSDCGFNYVTGSITSNSTNSGTVTGEGAVGGISGYNIGFVKSCINKNTANIYCSGRAAGGIVGSNQGTIAGSHNYADVVAEHSYAGGISGKNKGPDIENDLLVSIYTSIQDCSNSGKISSSGDYVGGIAGQLDNQIYANKNTGSVAGNSYVGGVCGVFNNDNTWCEDSKIIACYNIGAVTGSSNIGGVVGGVDSNNPNYEVKFLIQACYNTGEVLGSNNVGAVSGILRGSKKYSIVISDNYWEGNNSLSDVGKIETNKTPEVIDNMLFASGQWPDKDPGKNWGVGNDPGSGKCWRAFADEFSTELPKLYWE